MAKFISFLFLTALLFSFQVNARDSQFFSKVTPTPVNNNNNLKVTQVPSNEGTVNKPEQQPAFIPETENSYGLYGHESGLNPPSTTTTTTTRTNASPYTTTTTYQPYKTEEDTRKYSNNNYYNFKKDAYNTNQNELSETRLTGTTYSNNNYYNKDAFGGKQDELSNTKYTEGEYNSMENRNNYNNNKYYYNNNASPVNDRYFYNNNNNNAANQRYYKNNAAANYNFNGERQGLSDTRFMEGGKYFYDVNYEKHNYPTQYGGSSRGVNSENWYNNKGYFGNNNVNSMEGYQNQEEFEDDQEDFQP